MMFVMRHRRYTCWLWTLAVVSDDACVRACMQQRCDSCYRLCPYCPSSPQLFEPLRYPCAPFPLQHDLAVCIALTLVAVALVPPHAAGAGAGHQRVHRGHALRGQQRQHGGAGVRRHTVRRLHLHPQEGAQRGQSRTSCCIVLNARRAWCSGESHGGSAVRRHYLRKQRRWGLRVCTCICDKGLRGCGICILLHYPERTAGLVFVQSLCIRKKVRSVPPELLRPLQMGAKGGKLVLVALARQRQRPSSRNLQRAS